MVLNLKTDGVVRGIKSLSKGFDRDRLDGIKRTIEPILKLAEEHRDLPELTEESEQAGAEVIDTNLLRHRLTDIKGAFETTFDARLNAKDGPTFTDSEVALMKRLERAAIKLDFGPKSSNRSAWLRAHDNGKTPTGRVTMSARIEMSRGDRPSHDRTRVRVDHNGLNA